MLASFLQWDKPVMAGLVGHLDSHGDALPIESGLPDQVRQ
jgi:hypothetical protein